MDTAVRERIERLAGGAAGQAEPGGTKDVAEPGGAADMAEPHDAMTQRSSPSTEHPVGSVVSLVVDDLDVHGDGVARTPDGLVVFVAGAFPQDRVRAEITQRAASYARARVVEVEQPSPLRAEPRCPVVGLCGGCPLMPMAYPAQLEFKRRLVQQALERIGGLDPGQLEVRPTIGMKVPWAYRNKAQYPVARGADGRVVVGFFRRGTHQVVPIDDCAVAHPTLVALARAGRRACEELGLEPYDEPSHAGTVRHLVCRAGQFTGQALVVVVTRTEEVSQLVRFAQALAREVPELVGLVQNVNPARTNVILGPVTRPVWGQDYLEEQVGHLRLRLSATAFFQVNSLQAARLYEEVRSIVRAFRAQHPGRRLVLWDLYCGIGGIGLYCAGEADEVVGVEEHPAAVADARLNARLNQISHARFVVGRVEEVLPRWAGRRTGGQDGARGGARDGAPGGARHRARDGARDGAREGEGNGAPEGAAAATAVVVDPPRAGLAAEALRALARTGPELLVYVSCNPVTLARDLGQFMRWTRSLGLRYQLGPVQPLDMFPHTAHVEVVAHLVRR